MGVYKTIQKRRTVRRFGQTPPSILQLRKYVDAARLAPSGANLQPLKYIIVHSEEMTEKIFERVHWAAYLAPEGTPGPDERPTAYIVQIADLEIKQNGYEFDAGAAVENILLAAEEDGIGCCWMCSIDFKEISNMLCLKATEKLVCVVAMGAKAEQPVEEHWHGSVKYYKDEEGRLHVPKRPLAEVVLGEM